jgi:prepilin-type N-terminal cleavage/methylation domain-containing protein
MRTNVFLRQSGLTLIESLIVVILFGIIAAVAVPRFPITDENPLSAALQTNLNTLQNAIKLYAIQHQGVFPGQFRHTDGIKTTTPDEAKSAFIAQLLQYSDASGRTSPTRKPGFPFGPYLSQGIPSNPVPPQSNDIQVVFDHSHLTSVEQTGWVVVVPSGQILPNTPPQSYP